MKTFVWVFGVAATFAFAVDLVYWFSSKVEPAGVALLSILTIALTFAAAYANVAERNARLAGDRPDERHENVAGEEIDIITTASPYPVLVAICVLFLIAGVVWSPLLGALALAALLLCLWQLGRESSRV